MNYTSIRPLHFVFKIGDRNKTIKFYRDILGMKVLRHEEFDEGCKAACNGPYDGKWSKTMIGYGPEDNHFVCELTYNYGISQYRKGNDYLGLYIQSSEAIERAKSTGCPTTVEGSYVKVEDPDGYPFYFSNQPQPTDKDPVQRVGLGSENLSASLEYYTKYLGMSVFNRGTTDACVGYGPEKTQIYLKDQGAPVDHAEGFGRIAFSSVTSDLKLLENVMKENKQKILTPHVTLHTPGKATVEVVILADPDGHEICIVGDEGFRKLSEFDPKGNELLNEAMEKDKSNEWFASKRSTD